MSKEFQITMAVGLGASAMVWVQMMYPLIPPTVGWPIVIVLVGLAIYFFIKGIRKKGNQESLVLTIQEYAIGLSGMTDYPQKPENAAWLRLKVAVNSIGKPIDTLDVIIDSETIHANNWSRKIVASFTAYFKVTEWRWKGEHQVELIAKVGGKSHSFGRTLIDFNIEPGGRGHQI